MSKEFPSQTYERLTKKKWPGGKSPEIGGLLKQYGITTPAGEASTNLALQKRMTSTSPTDVQIWSGTKEGAQQLDADMPEATKIFEGIKAKTTALQTQVAQQTGQLDLSGISDVSTQGGKQYIRGTEVIPTGDGGYSLAGKVVPANVHVPDFRKLHLPSGKNVLEAPVIQGNYKGIQGLNLVGFGGGANYFIAESPNVLPPITRNSSGTEIYKFPDGKTIGVANVVIKNYTGEQPTGEQISEPPIPGLEDLEEPTEDAVVDTTSIRDAEDQEEVEAEEEKIKLTQDEEDEIAGLERQKKIANLKEELGLTETEVPEAPTLKTTYETLRSEKGLAAIEEQINVLNKTIRDAQASIRQGMYNIEGELQPMELMGEAQQRLARQGQEKLDTLNRNKQVLLDEYNTKNAIIENIMNFTQQDFTNSRAEYQDKFTEAIQLNSIYQKEEEAEKMETNRERDDARANLQVVANMATSSGTSFDQLDPALQSLIRSQEIKAGIPSGTYEAMMKSKPGSTIMATTTGVDADGNEVITFVYQDKDGFPGMIKTVKTGQVKPTEDAFTPQESKRLEQAGLQDATRKEQLDYLYGDADEVTNIEDLRAVLTEGVTSLKNLKFTKGEAMDKMIEDVRDSVGIGEDATLPEAIEAAIKEIVNAAYAETEEGGGVGLAEKAQANWNALWGWVKKTGSFLWKGNK